MVDPEDLYGEDGAYVRGASMGAEASGNHHAAISIKKSQKKEKSGKVTSRKSKKVSGTGPEDVPVPSIEVESNGRDHETSSKRRTKEKGRVSKPGAKKSS